MSHVLLWILNARTLNGDNPIVSSRGDDESLPAMQFSHFNTAISPDEILVMKYNLSLTFEGQAIWQSIIPPNKLRREEAKCSSGIYFDLIVIANQQQAV